jgi:hypothetical protein
LPEFPLFRFPLFPISADCGLRIADCGFKKLPYDSCLTHFERGF